MKNLLILVIFIYINLNAAIITPIKEVKQFDKAKVSLGKELFFDKSFSKDNSISCASCHSDFGSDKRALSIGVEGKKGNIQSLSVFNAVNNFKQFWNGRASDLDEQIDGPVHNDVEMGVSEEGIEKKLISSEYYIDKFYTVYSKKPSYKLFKDAIVEFEKTLVTPNSKFDQYLKDENFLIPIEQKGFVLFKNYGCAVCHNGVNIGGNSMQLIGSVIEYPYVEGQADLYDITKDEADKNVFRVPSLRNISRTAPYFHDGSMITLEIAVVQMAYHNLGMVLDNDEAKAIVAFLKTLDGDIPTTWSQDVK